MFYVTRNERPLIVTRAEVTEQIYKRIWDNQIVDTDKIMSLMSIIKSKNTLKKYCLPSNRNHFNMS